MAMVRNLRNIITAGADLNPVYNTLADKDAIRRSGMLPFRLYTAYREIAGTAGTKLARTIDEALGAMCLNYPELGGRTAIFLDASWSMTSTLSEKSTVSIVEVAAVMAAAIGLISDDAYVYLFANDAKKLDANPTASVLGFTKQVMDAVGGGWTDMNAAFAQIEADGIDVDRIMVLSDNQANVGTKTAQSYLDHYRNAVGHDVWLHGWDFAGYGTTQFIGGKVNYLCGFSDRAIEFISTAERGFDTMAKAVEKVDLG